jgi:hypothetical protein
MSPAQGTFYLTRGNETRLVLGLIKLELKCADGSLSREERKDVDPKSVLVLVMVRNVSSSAFCPTFGVPSRSRIWRASLPIFILTDGGASYLLKISKQRITNQERIIKDKAFRRILKGRIREGGVGGGDVQQV